VIKVASLNTGRLVRSDLVWPCVGKAFRIAARTENRNTREADTGRSNPLFMIQEKRIQDATPTAVAGKAAMKIFPDDLLVT
jgi:hypothetical protein